MFLPYAEVSLVRSMGHQNFMSIELQHIEAMTPEFTLQLLDHITNHFSEESIIGRGGSGVVYKVVYDCTYIFYYLNGMIILYITMKFSTGCIGKR